MSRAEKPLFIPLKRKFFEAFRDGKKSTEYRKYGSRWNEVTCAVGRRVLLSLGYGNRNRLTGVVVGFRLNPRPEEIPGWSECYGTAADSVGACIDIRLDTSKCC